MNSLDFLKPIANKCNVEALEAIVKERANWIERPSAFKYKEILSKLPNIDGVETNFSEHDVRIGKTGDLDPNLQELLLEKAKALIPWRKGPFNFFGTPIDSEWRSDMKWERIAPHIGDLSGKNVLDIGCNNGYFLFKLAQYNPRYLLGIDPVLHVKTQFEFLQHFIGNPIIHHELLGIEHLPHFPETFDLILSMGIIYHHRNPLQQLLDIKKSLRNNGELILETIGIPGDTPMALCPGDRYAKMKNVYFIPTVSCLVNWLHKAKFKNIKVLEVTPSTVEEQRLTEWCPPPHQSLQDFLNPNDSSLTIEGYPAPIRIAVHGTK